MNQILTLSPGIKKGEIISIFGLPGSGKTSLLLLLKLLPLWKKMFFLDMSALLTEAASSANQTPEDSAVIEAMANGQLAPDDYVQRVLFRKVNSLCETRTGLVGGIMTGIPRTVPQREKLADAGWNGSLKAGYINCNQETAYQRVVVRSANGTRLDDTQDGLETRFNRRCNDFNNQTLPVINCIKDVHPQNFFVIDDGLSLREKARTVITFMAGNTADKTLKNICAESLVALHEEGGTPHVNEALAYYENPESLPRDTFDKIRRYFHMTPLVG